MSFFFLRKSWWLNIYQHVIVGREGGQAGSCHLQPLRLAAGSLAEGKCLAAVAPQHHPVAKAEMGGLAD